MVSYDCMAFARLGILALNLMVKVPAQSGHHPSGFGVEIIGYFNNLVSGGTNRSGPYPHPMCEVAGPGSLDWDLLNAMAC